MPVINTVLLINNNYIILKPVYNIRNALHVTITCNSVNLCTCNSTCNNAMATLILLVLVKEK